MNHHVNNVKYVGWMLEVCITATVKFLFRFSRPFTKLSGFHLQTIASHFLERHQLSSIILEYRRECGSSDIVQSLCEPDDEETILQEGIKCDSHINLLNRFSLASEILEGSELIGSFSRGPLRFTHLLQINGCGSKKEEIVRGRTTWKKKTYSVPFPPS